MEKVDQLNEFKTHIDSLLQRNVPINTSFSPNVAKALEQYANDKGLNKSQDVIRLSVAAFLTKAGYL